MRYFYCKQTSFFRVLIAFLFLSLLTACGGGGSQAETNLINDLNDSFCNSILCEADRTVRLKTLKNMVLTINDLSIYYKDESNRNISPTEEAVINYDPAPSNGSIKFESGIFTYTPNLNYVGTDSFAISVEDGPVSEIVTVEVNVVETTPASPTVSSGSVSTSHDKSVDFSVQGEDANGDNLTFNIVSLPTDGTIEVVTNFPSQNKVGLRYTPKLNFVGSDSFTYNMYSINNNAERDFSNTATVSITVTNAVPTVNPIAVSVEQNSTTNISLLGSDEDDDALTYSIVSNPSNGTYTFTGNTFTYTPANDFIGSDSFIYEANDGIISSGRETVSITVTAKIADPLLSFSTPSTSEIGKLDVSGARDIIISSDGTKAYVAAETSGLQIINVTDPKAPVLLGSLATSDRAVAVALSTDGAIAYVADGLTGLLIINVSDPAAPVLLGSFDTLSATSDVELSNDGTIAFVTDGSDGLLIIDVSDPALPTLVSTFDNSLLDTGSAVDLALSNDGTIAYVADGDAGVHIIDVSDPALPTLLGNINVDADVDDVALSSDGTIAYVGTFLSGIRIFNVSNPAAPILLSSLEGFVVRNIEISNDGNTAYVSSSSTGLELIDVSDPAAPVLVGIMPGTDGVWGFTLSGDGTKAYIAKSRSVFSIVDVNTPIVPVLLGTLDAPITGFNFKLSVALSSDNSTAYVAAGSSGLEIVDVRSPAVPVLLSSFNSLEARDVALSSDGATAYLVGLSGLQLINVTDSAAPVLLGTLATLTEAFGIALSSDGNLAYVVDDSTGLHIVNVSDPASPVLLGNFDTLGSARGVTLSSDGAIAYVADGDTGLHIISVTDSAVPTLLGTFDTLGSALDVKLSRDGTKAFVADRIGLRIVDVSNPAAPILFGNLDNIFPDRVTLSKDDNIAYFRDSRGLNVIDVSNPATPLILHTLNVHDGSNTQGLTLSSDNTKAYLASGLGLRIIDLTVDTIHLAKNFTTINIPLMINSDDMQTLTLNVESDRTDIITVGDFSTELPNASYDGVAVNIPVSSLLDKVGQTILTVTVSVGTTTEVRKIYIKVYP